MSLKGLLRVAALVLLVVVFQGTRVLAGTVGTIQGTVMDANGHPIAGAAVTVASPSQTGHSTTDSKGFYAVLNLSPDTYTVTASKDGYDTTSVTGFTVQADQVTTADVTMQLTAKIIGHVTSTAVSSVVNKSVTGDLYAVNAQTVNAYQGSSGGAETLYSQNGVVGSMPGVVRTVGSGAGYFGQGTLSIRGGAYDQVGFELDGIPLNRGFDFYNGTSFLTNGISSLEVYTGGEPADAGRAMSGYINQVIQRGSYPGGADLTMMAGTPSYNHTLQTDVYGATPNNKFSYYVSTLALNFSNAFGNQTNEQGLTLNIPANDAGCGAFNASENRFGVTIPCGQANSLFAPISQGSYGSNTYANERDTTTNLNWSFAHNGLNDDLQALYVVGYTLTPQYDQYGAGPTTDGALNCEEIGTACTSTPGVFGPILWPSGTLYRAPVNTAYNSADNSLLTWPTANGSTGPIPNGIDDNQTTQYSIEKLGYTRALSDTSFVRVYGYQMYSFWTLNQPSEGIIGGTFYQLHDNATGVTMNYQNQFNSSNLLKFDLDYSKDLTLRYNYGNYFTQQITGGEVGGATLCYQDTNDEGNALLPNNLGACSGGQTVAQVKGPYAYWSSTTPEFSDAVLADTYKPTDKVTLDLGLRLDVFQFGLMPLQITGQNGLAEQAQNQFGICLHGYAYAAGEPCNGWDAALAAPGGGGLAADAPGAANWQNVSGNLRFNEFSPRFGFTYTASPQDVVRLSVGRYVQPPDSAFEEYQSAPFFGAGDTVAVLNRYYDGLGFLAVHDVQPEDSTNYDLSFEHEFTSGLSAKLTPFYRDTRGQILNLPVNPAQPSFVTGYNFGDAHISGVEFLLSKVRTGENGLSGAFSATYTDAKIRFEKAADGASFIDVENNAIKAYNAQYGTNYALLDPNAYYYPSYTQSPLTTSPSYTVPFVFTLTLDERTHGFDIEPVFNYQSGNPYGDPGLFLDAHCPNPGPAGTGGNPPGCIVNTTGLAPLAVGPDPYTNVFDAPGSLKGPSWMSMNLTLSHDIGHATKASFLVTNLFTMIHNQGYAWELPTSAGSISYGDNYFYNLIPLGTPVGSGAYQGDNYYPYAPAGIIPAREYVFSVSTKI
jgi:hypothetical protein